MNLRTLFAIPVTIILLVTLAMATMIAGQGWSGQERGKAAVDAVENMRALLLLQSELREERIASNLALGKQHPIPDAVLARLAKERKDVDRRVTGIVGRFRAMGQRSDVHDTESQLVTLLVRLGMARAAVDRLLGRPASERTFVALSAIQPMMIWASQGLELPVERASVAAISADPSLSGLLTEERLATALRDRVGLIAAVTVPRANSGESLSADDEETVRVLVAQASYLLRLLRDTIEMVGATEPMRKSLADLEASDRSGLLRQLTERAQHGMRSAGDTTDFLLPQQILVPWGEQVNVLRLAIVDTVVARVTDGHLRREREFDVVITGFGLVVIAILEAIFLLRRRIVSPLAQLGVAITRIAAGDRSVPMTMKSDTKEIAEMVTAVETLRQAALFADITAMRQRMAARQRLLLLREALGIAQTVREPSRALELGVARLSMGIDATVALAATAIANPPATLCFAADAIKTGLAEMRGSAAELDATFAAASSAQTDDCPEAEFVAHVTAVRAHVDRRDATVRAFIQPSLVALRDAKGATGGTDAAELRTLVNDQFERIEATVATLASMRDAVTRATAIIRELPLEDAPLAA